MSGNTLRYLILDAKGPAARMWIERYDNHWKDKADGGRIMAEFIAAARHMESYRYDFIENPEPEEVSMYDPDDEIIDAILDDGRHFCIAINRELETFSAEEVRADAESTR